MAFKNNEVQNRYLWGAKQDELLCKNDEWTLGDHLNTVRDVVKSDGSVAKHLEYNAFGELQGEPADELTFAYTGKLFDAKTQLQWNINRWYDAKVGRWCSEDPIGFEAKDWNLNRYVGNGSLIASDPLGHRFANNSLPCVQTPPEALYSCGQALQLCNLGAAAGYAGCAASLIAGIGFLDFTACLTGCTKVPTPIGTASCTTVCTTASLIVSAYLTLPICDQALQDGEMKVSVPRMTYSEPAFVGR